MHEWFFTAPIDEVAFRRGDPLGMRAYADKMAELLAPGLSNRTVDARWISILCWALQQAEKAWKVHGARKGEMFSSSRGSAEEIYSWLRPLELLWVARTIKMTKDAGKGRQLPGIRAVKSWLDDPKARRCSSSRFGLSSESYRRYRFTGIYGAYRVALRSLPGLTINGNGWLLDELGKKLADFVGKEVKCSKMHKLKPGKRKGPEGYWLEHVKWAHGGAHLLPTILKSPRRIEDPDERDCLKQALFTSSDQSETFGGSRRLQVAKAAQNSSSLSLPGLFADIASDLGGRKAPPELALLSSFCQLADAGIDAMNACWNEMKKTERAMLGMKSSDLFSSQEVKGSFKALQESAKRWKREYRKNTNAAARIANELAEAIINAKNNQKQFHALEQHHNRYGSGLKWLTLDNGYIKPLAPLRGTLASKYSFRIHALCRLAVQTGTIKKMPPALRDNRDLDSEANGEGD